MPARRLRRWFQLKSALEEGVPSQEPVVDPRGEELVALNFRVPASFRMQMKRLAAIRATTMTQLLYEGFALIEQESGTDYVSGSGKTA